MNSSIEVHSDLRIGDLYWLFFSNAIRKVIYARWILTLALVFLVAVGPQYIAFAAFLLVPPLVYLLLGGLLFVTFILPFLRSRAFVRATMGTSNTLSCTIGPHGIDVRRQSSQAHYDWEAIRKAKQTSKLILIFFDGHSCLVIPKRSFANSQQLNEVRSMIVPYAKSKVKERDYWP